MTIITAKIFNTCEECGGEREKNDGNCILLQRKKYCISIVRCSCKKVTRHIELIREVELIGILQSRGIALWQEKYE